MCIRDRRRVRDSKMKEAQTWEERYEIITRHLVRDADGNQIGVVGESALKEKLKKGEEIKVYWGTATTGKPHLGYFLPIYKLSDFLQAGCSVTVLFADLHGFLDNMKSSWELLAYRCKWYELVIKSMLEQIGVPLDKLKFVRGRDYQLTEKYTLDMYKMSALVTTGHTTKAGAEVVKKSDSAPLMSSLLYPILQALDEEYLGVDVQFGGLDQRKIFMFARENLPKIGYKKRCHLMNPMIPGLGKSGKMSSSEPNSKVDFDDSDKVIRKKLGGAFSKDGQVEGNGVMAMAKYIVFRFLQRENRKLIVKRDEKWGGDREYASYEELEEDFVGLKMASEDLKAALGEELVKLITPLREIMDKNQQLRLQAYPPPAKGNKKGAKGPQYSMGEADVRVVKIVSVTETEKTLEYVVNAGDKGEFKAVTGKLKVADIAKLQGALSLAVINLRNKGDDKFCKIVLSCTPDKREKYLLKVPAGSEVGERVHWEGINDVPVPSLAAKRLARLLSLNAVQDGKVFYDKLEWNTSSGIVTSDLKNGIIHP
eukprot:TRINITY_DN5329_c0_g1_i1.p1 TRINITY_DN5329_c0_g1~~TRINITY_DN5329_c0_g1_i1.p1  ORF type:complete len:538 (-),score=98.22 TRINITY_DN5329_c0_g1_i1:552-2165(-)